MVIWNQRAVMVLSVKTIQGQVMMNKLRRLLPDARPTEGWAILRGILLTSRAAIRQNTWWLPDATRSASLSDYGAVQADGVHAASDKFRHHDKNGTEGSYPFVVLVNS